MGALFIFLFLVLPIHNLIFSVYGLVTKKIKWGHVFVFLFCAVLIPLMINSFAPPSTDFGRGPVMSINFFTVLATIVLANLVYAFFLCIKCWWKHNSDRTSLGVIDN